MQPRSYEPRALPIELPRLSLLRLTSSLTIDRRLESNQRPRKVLMHPLRALTVCATPDYRLLKCLKAPLRCEEYYTGDRFRSCVLGIMSPARYPCATPAWYLLMVLIHRHPGYEPGALPLS